MSQNEDEETLSDVNKSCLLEIEDVKLGKNDEIKRAEQCELFSGLGESNLDVDGERDETLSLEDRPAAAEGGEAAVLEKSELTVEAIGQTEVVVEAKVAEESAAEVNDARIENQSLEIKAEEESLEDATTVVTDTVDVQFETQLGKDEGATTDVTDTRDERFEPQLGKEAADELAPVIEATPTVEVAVADLGDAQPFSDSQMDTTIDGLMTEIEGMEVDNARTEMGDGERIEEVGGRSNDLIETSIEEKDTEIVEEGEENEEKVSVMVKDLEVSNAEGDGEKVDPLIMEGIITEVKADAVLDNEQEHVIKLNDDIKDVSGDVKYEHAENEEVAAEATSMSGAKIIDDNRSVAENNDLVVEEEYPAGDVKMEMEVCAELELTKNDAAEEIQMENQAMDDNVLDEAAKMETDETRSDVDEPSEEATLDAHHDEDNETVFAEEETGTQDTEIETETDGTELGKASAGKRKRGKLTVSKPTARSSSRKTIGEDVCFICFDGGDLFLCDRRRCPKAYHPSCVNRDEAFFRAKGRWNCGWHLCSICEKTARYMCYTCTFSLCRSCTKDAVILLVKGNKGFCETCMRTVNLVENNEQGNKEEQSQINFDDKSSWEYLFKDYYIELKSKLSLSYDEIKEAKNPCKGADVSSGSRKHESSAKQADADDNGSDSEDSIDKLQTSRPKRRKLRKHSKDVTTGDKATSSPDKSDWASKEVLEFVSQMRDGDTSMISQFDVQELLLKYIKSNKLRDPRRKSQIVCDARLESLFGKPRVGHFEMLKLLESHFYARDEQNDDGQGSVVDTESNQLDIDENGDLGKGKKRKTRRTSGSFVRQSNLDDYAAIDMHNISLIYLKRKLMEDLLEDDASFHEKAVGTFVRIRISGSNQKHDLYRLVQVVGTTKSPEPYKVGKKTTDIMVEILNLDKTEVVSIDIISNQEFTEDECKRLRQSIKCGLLSRLSVGEILDKAIEIQVARVNDWLESETLRLSHLRDRASDLGRRKELRECVEKLQLLKTPEERRRRLDEIPKVHADPKMDPTYESDENDSENEDSRRDAFMRSKGFNRKGRGPISPGTDSSPKESWSSATKVPNKNWEFSRNLSSNNFSAASNHASEMVNENSWNSGDKSTQEPINVEKLNPASNSDPAERVARTASLSESFTGGSQSPVPSTVTENVVKINESEKMWHYRDPSGKEQGPFSIVQLRKWNNSGYFPDDLKIWRNTETESNSILLADALAGKFPKDLPSDDISILHTAAHSGKVSERPHVDRSPRPAKLSKWDVASEITSLHSPTPQSNTAPIPRGNGEIPSPTVVPNAATHSPSTTSVLNSVGQTGVPYSPTPNFQQVNPVGPTHQSTEPHAVQVQAHGRPSAIQTGQAASNQNLQSESWTQPQGHAMVTPNIPNPSGTFSNSSPAALPQWPSQGCQTNMQPPTTANVSWGMLPANSNAGCGPVPTVTNAGWPSWTPPVQTPNLGNTNPGWIAPPIVGAPPMNPGWGPPAQGWGPKPVQGQVWTPRSGNPGAPVQGPISGNGWGPPNGNPGAHPPPVQGPARPNANQGWGPPPANQGPWVGEQNHNNGGQFQGHAGGQGRDSGFSGSSRPWNRRGGGNFNRRDMVCPYNGKGRCRKGAFCDYRHI